MKNLLLKLDDSIFDEMESIIVQLNISRNNYIVQAVECYNLIQKREFINQLKRESIIVKEESLKVLAEFKKTE